MKYGIIDAALPLGAQSGFGLSAQYVRWECKRHGILEHDPRDADIIFVSCQSTESIPALKTIKNNYKKAKIIIGGGASSSPYTLSDYGTVIIGDGQKFFCELFTRGLDVAMELPNVYWKDKQRAVDIDNSFPWDMPPIQAEDGAFRVWCGRGCKNKCLFCQTGWAYRYSENPNPDKLVKTARRIINNGHRVAYLSNDLAQHAFFSSLPATDHGSYSVRYIERYGIPRARQIRLGVEGVSAGLRRSVAKPIDYDELLNCTVALNNSGKSVRWFMIAGLPGESNDDWEELKSIVQDWKTKTTKGVLALSFTAYKPEPATPMQTMPIDDLYWDRYVDFKNWFFSGKGFSNRIKLMNPQQPKNRMVTAMRQMGLTEDQLREGGHLSPNFSIINYPYKDNKIYNLFKNNKFTH